MRTIYCTFIHIKAKGNQFIKIDNIFNLKILSDSESTVSSAHRECKMQNKYISLSLKGSSICPLLAN